MPITPIAQHTGTVLAITCKNPFDIIFGAFVDGVSIGVLPNGVSLDFNVTPGKHCILVQQVGESYSNYPSTVWIDVPAGNAKVSVVLEFYGTTWGLRCDQMNLVMTEPPNDDYPRCAQCGKDLSDGTRCCPICGKFYEGALKPSGARIPFIGVVCVAIGIFGIIIGWMLFPSSSGTVSAEEHIERLDAMNLATLFLIGGIAFSCIGGAIIRASQRKAKNKKTVLE